MAGSRGIGWRKVNRLNRSTRALIATIVIVIAVLAVATFNWINVSEAYGGGPPYYSRTTNMDKWTNPLPVLAAVDTLTLIAALALIYLIRRGNRKETQN